MRIASLIVLGLLVLLQLALLALRIAGVIPTGPAGWLLAVVCVCINVGCFVYVENITRRL